LFDRDLWREIADNLARHPTRSLLTALGVFWGMFLLISMIGLGKGLEHGLLQLFKDWAFNSAWIEGGKTSLPYQGLTPGRPVKLRIEDLQALSRLPGVTSASPEKHLPSEYTVRHGQRTGAFEIYGIYPAYHILAKNILTAGRLLNPLDEKEARKVAVLGQRVVDLLYTAGQNPVGSTVWIAQNPFRVVGAYNDAGGEAEIQRIYIPFSTLRNSFEPSPELNWIGLAIAPEQTWERLRPMVLGYLAKKYRFDPEDTGAIYAWDYTAQYSQVQSLLSGVRWFILLVGMGALAAGCMGVSNIMLVTVKERTREFGIRKAIGATPKAILGMLLLEALSITALAGGAGSAAGIAVIETIRESGLETEYFRDPEIDPVIAVLAFSALLLCGAIAGLLPALHALRIQPIDALRHE
jgi:putative ABC transport system permease protein